MRNDERFERIAVHIIFSMGLDVVLSRAAKGTNKRPCSYVIQLMHVCLCVRVCALVYTYDMTNYNNSSSISTITVH